jgi:hypothetical protein
LKNNFSVFPKLQEQKVPNLGYLKHNSENRLKKDVIVKEVLRDMKVQFRTEFHL